MAPPADHLDHWQTQSTSIQPSRIPEARSISTESDRYNTRSRNRARSNEGVGGTYISSPPPEEAHNNTVSQTDYIMVPSSHPPHSVVKGQNLFHEPFEIQVRGRYGVTGQIRENLALGRLFGVLTLVPSNGSLHTGINGAERSSTSPEQIVAAVSPVPSLDDASDSSPPPPFVAGILSFSSFQVRHAGRWRLSIALLRVNNSVAPLNAPQEGVVSLGSYETAEILVH